MNTTEKKGTIIMINICICDDNSILIHNEEQEIRKILRKHNINASITTFSSGEDLLLHAKKFGEEIDIIFLDVIMDKINGIETANQLRNLNCNAQIIFLTSSKEHVFSSFDSNPLHYLLKDGTEYEKIEPLLLKAIELINKNNQMFIFKKGAYTKRIPLTKIRYFEILGRVMNIYYEDQVFEYYKKIDELESELKTHSFCRVHRSYIVNLNFVSQLSRNGIILVNGVTLPVSRSYYPIVRKHLASYLSKGH